MRMEKRIFLAVLTAAFMAFLLTGCGSSGKETADVEPQELGQKLLEGLEWKDIMEPVGQEALYKIYDVDKEDVESAAAWQSTGATAEEIALWKCRDDKAADRVYAAMEERVADQKESFTDYNPEELDKLENPVLVKRGRYVFLCLSNENAKAKELMGE